jgi:hypothetical protein
VIGDWNLESGIRKWKLETGDWELEAVRPCPNGILRLPGPADVADIVEPFVDRRQVDQHIEVSCKLAIPSAPISQRMIAALPSA